MSFRRRIVLLSAGAVAASIVIASVVVYFVTRNELRGQVDAALRRRLIPGPQSVEVTRHVGAAEVRKLEREGKIPAQKLEKAGASAGSVMAGGNSGYVLGEPISSTGGQTVHVQLQSAGAGASFRVRAFEALIKSHPALPSPTRLAGPRPGERLQLVLPAEKAGGPTGFAQLLAPDGQLIRSSGASAGPPLPVTSATRAVGAGKHGAFLSDATVSGTHVRVLTEGVPLGGVLQVAYPLTEVDRTLSHLELLLAIVSAGGIALAAALGLLVSRAALVPVRKLTGAAERVTHTHDLAHRINAGEGDELGRLAASFNTMLAALERANLAQRQLVSDASHELRTPLTSVRANLDALATDQRSSGNRLSDTERERVIASARAQLAELTVLVGDLVDLSKTEVDAVEVEPVRLDLAAAEAIERARVHAPHCRFELHAQPCLVAAAPARLDRAIANLLDNAVKWGPRGGPVEVHVRDGRLDVRDGGPGIDPEDLPHVFDRFYRSRTARGLPGSGLGLAIVRQVAETHGGSVRAANDSQGGARLTLELPALPMRAEDATDAAAQPSPSAEPRVPAG
jgi:two-component system, OmpR family, sensor histidine kinase MprB